MDFHNALQYGAFVIVLTICVKLLGGYLERVFSGQRTALDRFCAPLEKLLCRLNRRGSHQGNDANMIGLDRIRHSCKIDHCLIQVHAVGKDVVPLRQSGMLRSADIKAGIDPAINLNAAGPPFRTGGTAL
jgi:hypothetical protein